MMDFLEVFLNAILGSFNWTLRSIMFDVPFYENYFWGLILISVLVWVLEILFPWRKNQAVFRKDFALDVFYMFFNLLDKPVCHMEYQKLKHLYQKYP